MTKRLDILLSALFLLGISAPAIMHGTRLAMGQDTAQIEGENRAAAGWQTVRNAASVRERTSALAAYLSDRFGMRRAYLSVYASLRDELSLMGAGDQVVVGQEGWLFFTLQRALEDYQGLVTPTDAELSAFATALREVDARVRENGASFAVLIAPSKQTVYGEYLPPYIKRTSAGTRAERQIPALRAAGLDVIDPAGALRAAKATAQLYHKTDTHWSDAGAYTAYRALMTSLQAKGVDVPLLPAGQLTKEDRDPAGFTGDLIALGQFAGFDETSPVWRVTTPAPATIDRTKNEELPKEFWDRTILRQDVVGRDLPTLLVIGDSFVEALLPFLQESFGTIHVVRSPDIEIDLADLETYPADVVLFEIVERNLRNPLTIK